MELYIEKVFLDDFCSNFKKTEIQNILQRVFNEYGNKMVFMNFSSESKEEFETLKLKNEIFALMCSNDMAPIPIENIEEHLFHKSNFEQTLVFMKNEEVWFDEAKEKGALCFSFENFEKDIKDISEQLRFKIDLSEKPFEGWHFLSKFKCLNFNYLMITDGYIISDKDNQKIQDNLIPILNTIFIDKNGKLKLDVITKDLNPLSSSAKHKKEKAKKRHKTIVQNVPKIASSNMTIYMDDPALNIYDFHDRIIQTNFSITECGKGFNLKKSTLSNSQIISDTIFDYYTYKRLKNHKVMQLKYLSKLKGSGNTSDNFYLYPEKF